MRFKTTVENLTLLSNLLQSAEKIGKRAILKLTDSTLFLICAKGEGDVQMWSNIPVDSIFSDYRIESMSNDNTIALEIPITPFLQALRAGSSGGIGENRDTPEITLRLVRKEDAAALCIEVKTQKKDGKHAQVTHDVHVLVRRPLDLEEITQPQCPPLEAHIELPPAEQCRPVVEHLARIADIIWLGATKDGRFRLSIETTAGDVETVWSGMRTTTVTSGDDEDEEMEDESPDSSPWRSVPLSSRTLQRWFTSQIVQTHVIAGIAPLYCLVAYVYIGDRYQGGVITYYIPSRNISME